MVFFGSGPVAIDDRPTKSLVFERGHEYIIGAYLIIGSQDLIEPHRFAGIHIQIDTTHSRKRQHSSVSSIPVML